MKNIKISCVVICLFSVALFAHERKRLPLFVFAPAKKACLTLAKSTTCQSSSKTDNSSDSEADVLHTAPLPEIFDQWENVASRRSVFSDILGIPDQAKRHKALIHFFNHPKITKDAKRAAIDMMFTHAMLDTAELRETEILVRFFNRRFIDKATINVRDFKVIRKDYTGDEHNLLLVTAIDENNEPVVQTLISLGLLQDWECYCEVLLHNKESEFKALLSRMPVRRTKSVSSLEKDVQEYLRETAYPFDYIYEHNTPLNTFADYGVDLEEYGDDLIKCGFDVNARSYHTGRTSLQDHRLPVCPLLLAHQGSHADNEFVEPIQWLHARGARPDGNIFITALENLCKYPLKTPRTQPLHKTDLKRSKMLLTCCELLKIYGENGLDRVLKPEERVAFAIVTGQNQFIELATGEQLDSACFTDAAYTSEERFFTPAMIAAACHNNDALRILLAKPGIDLTAEGCEEYTTALDYAMKHFNYEGARMLWDNPDVQAYEEGCKQHKQKIVSFLSQQQ